MTTILSRFDCIFIVRDVREAERDRDIARHVLGKPDDEQDVGENQHKLIGRCYRCPHPLVHGSGHPQHAASAVSRHTEEVHHVLPCSLRTSAE